MEVLFNLKNWEIKIIFLCMLGTQSTFCKEKVWEGVEREVESLWVIGRPEPSPITMSSELSYKVWIDRLLKSVVTWCDASLLRSQLEFSNAVIVARFAYDCQCCGGRGFHCWGERDCHCFGWEARVKVRVNGNKQ